MAIAHSQKEEEKKRESCTHLLALALLSFGIDQYKQNGKCQINSNMLMPVYKNESSKILFYDRFGLTVHNLFFFFFLLHASFVRNFVEFFLCIILIHDTKS